jgi:signal peptide peptidase SppA
MTFLPLLADRILGQPLLITAEKLEVILGVLGGRIGLEDALQAPAPDANRFAGRESQRGPYRVTSNGIAIVPIIGSLVNRGAYIGASSGLTSYEGITEQLKKASTDSEVRGILLDMNTPGGEAAGTFEVSKLIMEIRKKKPVVAMVADMACSAGYAIASAANQIYTTQTGVLGSIGVVWVHFDRSQQMQNDGIKPTILHAGARKAEGNPFEPLSRVTKANFQAEIDKLHTLFIETVLEGRPSLKEADLRATEAAVFMGQDAVKIGLADGVSTFDRVLEVMSQQITKLPAAPAGYESNPKEKKAMTNQPAAEAASGTDQAALDAARADGVKAGRTEERARIASILALPEAKGRQALALELATGSDMNIDSCAKMLAKAAEEKPDASATNSFYAAIEASGGKPNVSLSGGEAQPKDRSQANIERQTRRFAARA